MEIIYLLTDYLNRFGSKHFDSPYRSGMNKELLRNYFREHGFKTEEITFSEVFQKGIDFKNRYVIYTSSEDIGYHYKSFIEDILLALENAGAIIIPFYKYLRANNNKVFMELLRMELPDNSISSFVFGTYEEAHGFLDRIKFPCVIKTAEGASGSGVHLAHNECEFKKIIKKISRTKYLVEELWDYGRELRHKGYVRESLHRKKFIIQEFIEGLKDDWKVLIYNNKYFVLNRKTRNHDFRASGSGNFSFTKLIPEGLLDYASKIFLGFDVPFISLDIAFNDNKFFLLEFQAIYFGTYTVAKAPFYFENDGEKWNLIQGTLDIERLSVESIINFINRFKIIS